MTDRRLRLAVGVLSAAGAAVAGYLVYARYTDTTLACATGGCETVQRSDYALIAGIPVAVLGLGAYLVLLATAFSTSEIARVRGRRRRGLGHALRRLPAVRAESPSSTPSANGASPATS